MQNNVVREPTKADYESLAAFRRALRTFLGFAERAAREVDVTPQQHQVLLAVAGQPERDWASVGELRDALQIAHHAAVGLVDRMQAAGLVERSPDPRDRRVVRVALTEEGTRRLAEITRRNLTDTSGLDALTAALNQVGSSER